MRTVFNEVTTCTLLTQVYGTDGGIRTHTRSGFGDRPTQPTLAGIEMERPTGNDPVTPRWQRGILPIKLRTRKMATCKGLEPFDPAD